MMDDGPGFSSEQYEREPPPRTGPNGGAAPKIEPLRFADVGDWDNRPDREKDWVVENRVPANDVTLLSGHGAVGKTTITAQAAVINIKAKLTGTTQYWLGSAVHRGGDSLFFTGEESDDDVQMRMRPILAHYDLTWRQIKPHFHLFCIPVDDATLAYPDHAGEMKPTPLYLRLRQAVLDIKPRLASFESVTDIFGGREIDRRQVNQFIRMFMRPLAINGAVFMLGHTSRAGMTTNSGDSGSTQWHNRTRSRMWLRGIKDNKNSKKKKDAEDEDDELGTSNLRELVFMKNNWGQRDPTIKLRWADGLFHVEGSLSSLSKIAREAEIDSMFMTLFRRMLDQGQHLGHNKGPTYAPAKLADHPEAGNMTSAQFAQAMQRLLDLGKIQIVTSGPPSKRRQSLSIAG